MRAWRVEPFDSVYFANTSISHQTAGDAIAAFNVDVYLYLGDRTYLIDLLRDRVAAAFMMPGDLDAFDCCLICGGKKLLLIVPFEPQLFTAVFTRLPTMGRVVMLYGRPKGLWGGEADGGDAARAIMFRECASIHGAAALGIEYRWCRGLYMSVSRQQLEFIEAYRRGCCNGDEKAVRSELRIEWKSEDDRSGWLDV